MSKGSEARKLVETEERDMNEADRVRVGNELANVDREIISIKEEKKTVNREYRARLNKLEERADVLSKQLQDGVTEDSFEVLEEHDDERLMVDIMRKDTGRRISTRQMTEPEKEAARKRKQVDLPFDGGAKGKGKSKAKDDDDGIIDDADVPTDAVAAQRSRGRRAKAK